MAIEDMLTRNKGKYTNRVLVGTPTLGVVRMEWVHGRYGQTIPTNWSHVDMIQWMNPYLPIGYQVADAENLIAKIAVEQDFEWLLSWEDDNIPSAGALVKLNEYMIKADVPVVSGLYFTKSVPPEPILYRDSGKGYYADWKLGEKVWVSGIPFGFTLIHGSILKVLWKESPEYVVNGITTRRVFQAPQDSFVDPSGGWMNHSGTSDLEWCARMKKEKIFEKAGWPEFQKKDHPFLVDTSIYVRHIDRQTGAQYPINLPTDFVNGKITWKDTINMEDGPVKGI